MYCPDCKTVKDPDIDIHYTENGQELRIGDGLWATASASGKYKLYVTDPESGQIGFFGTISDNGEINLMALRLKIYETIWVVKTSRRQTGSAL